MWNSGSTRRSHDRRRPPRPGGGISIAASGQAGDNEPLGGDDIDRASGFAWCQADLGGHGCAGFGSGAGSLNGGFGQRNCWPGWMSMMARGFHRLRPRPQWSIGHSFWSAAARLLRPRRRCALAGGPRSDCSHASTSPMARSSGCARHHPQLTPNLGLAAPAAAMVTQPTESTSPVKDRLGLGVKLKPSTTSVGGKNREQAARRRKMIIPISLWRSRGGTAVHGVSRTGFRFPDCNCFSGTAFFRRTCRVILRAVEVVAGGGGIGIAFSSVIGATCSFLPEAVRGPSGLVGLRTIQLLGVAAA